MINLIGIYLIFLSSLTFADATTDSYYHSHKKDANLSLDDAVISISEKFLGKPYVFDALADPGEQSYTIRGDAFDCVTFVDTVLALSLAEHKDQFSALWHKFRYQDTQATRLERNHFTEVHWLGNLKPWLTACHGLPGSATASARVDVGARYAWYCHASGLAEKDCLPYKNRPAQKVTLSYIPTETWLSKNEDLNKNLPKTMLVLVINQGRHQLKQKIGTDMLVSHLGFLYQSKHGLRFRHASLSHKKVVDVDFMDYVSSRKGGTVVGYAVYAIHA